MDITINMEKITLIFRGNYFKGNPGISGFKDTNTPNPSRADEPPEPESFETEQVWWEKQSGDTINVTDLINELGIDFEPIILKKIHEE